MSGKDRPTRPCNTPIPTQVEIDELLAFLPIFSSAGYQPVLAWHGGPVGEEKSLAPWPIYEDAVGEFIRVASKDCWSDGSYDPAEASRMVEDKAKIKEANLTDIRRMLTFCVRGERFCDGHIGGMIYEGYVRRILERLAEITRH